MDQFVTVRLVQGNSMDLTLFQFDLDLTFAVFFMNADKTIYGRYGTRSDQKQAMREISMESFGKALRAALDIHKYYPSNKASLAGKHGPKPRYAKPEQYPDLKKFKANLDYQGQVSRSCMHCHMIQAAERKAWRSQRKAPPDRVLYPWPMPDVVGLSLDPKEKAKVAKVARGSAAEKARFRPRDEILKLNGQPILSIADVQWVLHSAEAPATIEAEVLRSGTTGTWKLALKEDWRRTSSISWRTSTWDMRRTALGGMILRNSTTEERRKAGLGKGGMALFVKGAGRHGAYRVARNRGFLPNDIIVDFGGLRDAKNESQLIAELMRTRMPGEKVPVKIVRGRKQMKLNLPMQ